ncbi:hypothetical protein DFH06DRAFT_1370887 [Mycena polygramma]|nr:hypothetical protein DFH06DRAFT_1370887 [Mycena polygramma]
MDYYNAQRNAARGSRPTFTEQDMKVLLRNRLNDGQLPNMPAGFPFRHVLDPRGAAHISYDPFEFHAAFDVPAKTKRDSRGDGMHENEPPSPYSTTAST